MPAADPAPELNPNLDRACLGEAFRRAGRIHIPNVLTDASAARLLRALEHETLWTVTLNNGSDIQDFISTPKERERISLAAWGRARSGFQFLHDHHLLSHKGEPYRDPHHYLAQLVTFLNSPAVFAFMRDVTGLDAITWMNAQATLYRPGDFLTVHDDLHGDHNRLIAYVLNMTPVWQPDWGGALQFFDARDHVEEGYLPTFNALNLFRVPKVHSVSQVAMFAGLRYSVTGWYHAPDTD